MPQVLQTLITFTGANGADPTGPLSFDPQGNLLGTTLDGGLNNLGTVYILPANGPAQTLYSLNGNPDGVNPYGVLVDPQGNIYGTATNGGKFGGGTVYRLNLNPRPVLQVLNAFSGPDGLSPVGLTFDNNFDLYGVTVQGGGNNCGTIYKVTPAGVFTTLHHFSGPDGMSPSPGLAFDKAGNLWGSTKNGGPGNVGVIFRLSLGGVLHVTAFFPGPPRGACPAAGVILDNLGNVYGTTEYGGANFIGSIFELPVPSNFVLLTLFSFAAGNGSPGVATPVFDSVGRFYGTTWSGGARHSGTIFQLLPPAGGGKLIQLHSFAVVDGAHPGSLLAHQSGFGPNPGSIFLYGNTYGGGAAGLGTVFRLEIP